MKYEYYSSLKTPTCKFLVYEMHIYQFLEISCFQFMKFIYENKRKSEMLTKVSLLYVLEKLNVFLMIFLKCTFSSHFLV
jgi:hypothetical protein